EEERRYWEAKVVGKRGMKLGRGGTGGERLIRQVKKDVKPEVQVGVKEMAKELEVSVKSVLLAGHLKVMSVLSGEEEVVSGLVMNGRLEEEDGERVLGVFLNTLPVRVEMRGRSWKEVVKKVQEEEGEVMKHR